MITNSTQGEFKMKNFKKLFVMFGIMFFLFSATPVNKKSYDRYVNKYDISFMNSKKSHKCQEKKGKLVYNSNETKSSYQVLFTENA